MPQMPCSHSDTAPAVEDHFEHMDNKGMHGSPDAGQAPAEAALLPAQASLDLDIPADEAAFLRSLGWQESDSSDEGGFMTEVVTMYAHLLSSDKAPEAWQHCVSRTPLTEAQKVMALSSMSRDGARHLGRWPHS